MAELHRQLRAVENEAREVTAKAGPWIRWVARAGYAANGVTYVLAGTLALLAAFSFASGRTGGVVAALGDLLSHPFGWVVLILIAAGLVGYALWCFVLAIADPERKGRNWTGLRLRFVFLCKGVVYLGLVAVVIGTAVGVIHATSHPDPTERWTARLMSLPLGIWLVAVVGGCVIATGVVQFVQTWRPRQLADRLDLARVGAGWGKWLLGVGRFGVAARGLIFLVIGTFMVMAAYHANPHEAKGVGRAMRFVQHQPEGRWLLAGVALGLISYGLFQFVLARYRRIDPA